jgi:hypothetical protein
VADELANGPTFPETRTSRIYTHPRYDNVLVLMIRDSQNRPTDALYGDDVFDLSVESVKMGYGQPVNVPYDAEPPGVRDPDLDMFLKAQERLQVYTASLAVTELNEILDTSLAEQIDPMALDAIAADLELSTFHREKVNAQIKDLQESAEITQQRIDQAQEFLRRDDISHTAREVGEATLTTEQNLLMNQTGRIADLTRLKGIDPNNPHHKSLTYRSNGPEADGPELGAVPTGPTPDQGPTGSEAEIDYADLDADDLRPTGPSAEAYLDDYLQETNDVAPTPAPDWTPEPPKPAPDMYSGEVITDSYELTRQIEAQWAAQRAAPPTQVADTSLYAEGTTEAARAASISMKTFPDSHAAAMDPSRGQIQKSTAPSKKASKGKVLKRGGRR